MKSPIHQASRSRARQGFTLLELVVVVAVLVILAGFILPKFDVFKLKANKGVAAANMSGISRLIQQYYAQNSVYPDGWDSLLDGSGALWKPGAPGTTKGLDPQLVGGPPAASPEKLTVSTALTDKEARSLARIGISKVYDTASTTADPFAGLPNDAFTESRDIDTGAIVATLNSAGSTPDEDAVNIVNHIYPDGNGVPSDKKLVVFGLGSHSSMLGQLMQEVPFYSNTDQTQYYSRYLVVFQVSSGGSRAELKAVIGADGDMIKEEIADYYER